MKIFLTIAAIMSLVLMSFAFAAVDEEGVGASVTVNEFVSITLTDPGVPGVKFGSGDPGNSDIPDVAKGAGTPAIRVTNDVISNVDVKVNVKGTNFTDGNSNNFAAGQATYDDDELASEGGETGKPETTLANDYPVSDYYTGIAPGSDADFWFFLDIPTSQAAATYTSTLTFQGSS